ncbi:hypothetical protein KXX42_001069 [Aspergillus fumigatus]|nr:hypothetical protein KXX42_001069 [Aspergillus fumigatus]
MRDQLLVADTREKALEEHHKVLAGARGTSTVIAYMDLGSLDSHNVYAAELYTVEMTLTPEGNAESLSSLITKRRFGPAQSQRAHLVSTPYGRLVAPGHDGVCGNKRADQHAKGAADSMGAQWASAGALCHEGPHGPEPGGAWCFGSISLDRQELIACPTYLHGAPAPHGLTALTED